MTTTTSTVYAIAVVEPLSGDDVGFAWGTDRTHVLLCADSLDELAAAVTDHYGLADYPAPTMSACVDAVRDAYRHSNADVAGWSGEAGDLLTDWLPSAGSSEAWGDDVWLGLADYLSYFSWRRAAIGHYPELADIYGQNHYLLTEDDAGSAVANCGADAVRDACEYLRAYDPVRIMLECGLSRSVS